MTKESMTTLENIHKAAKEEFLEKGFKGASLRNIVKTAGMTTGAFYGYYGSKEELFSALVGSQYDTIMGEYIKAQTDFRQLDPSEQNKHMGDISGQCMCCHYDRNTLTLPRRLYGNTNRRSVLPSYYSFSVA